MTISRALRLLVLAFASAFPLAAQQPMFAELHRMLPHQGTATCSLAVTDVNNDGRPDIFMGGWHDRLYLNDGAAFFTDVTSHLPASNPYPNVATWSVAAGDVDGDGDADLLLGYGSNGFGSAYAPRLLLNDGTGNFAAATGHVPPAEIYFVTFGDVDGDGDVDAVGSRASGLPLLYLNDGAGFFTDATGTSLPPSLTSLCGVVALGDVDGDGDLDAFYACLGQNRLLLNTGSGAFVDATAQLPPISDSTSAIALADLDGDGDLDAVVGNSSGPGSLLVPSYVLLNTGSGVFAGPLFLAGGLQAVREIVVFDVDLDLDLDVLLVGSGAAQVYLNGAAPIGPIAIESLGNAWGGAAAADFDGDGDQDVVIESELHLNAHGAGLAQVKSINGPFSSFVHAVATGDVDGDGDRDLVTDGDGSPRLYKNDGAGVLTDVTAQTVFQNGAPPFGGTHALLADLDGDGDLDCFAGGLYLNNGIGLFFNASVFLPPNCLEVKALADVDGDGDVDAYTGQQNLLLNDGAAGFSYAAASLPQVAYDSNAPATFGDFDGDGDQDLLILGTSCAYPPSYFPRRLFLNTGAGTFIDASANVPNSWGVNAAVAVGDVDGDGDLDALVTGYCVSPAELLVNNGIGIFTAVPTPIPGGVGVALRDIDQDGDLDAVSGYPGAGLWLNSGTGAFYAAPNLMPPQTATATPTGLALEDFDGDGDVDILIGSIYLPGSQLLSNLTRQLSWRAPPRAGKPLSIDIVGPPNGAWLLIADTVTTSIPMQPLGILRLDPATSAIVGSGSLDAQGRAAVSFAVPLTAPIGFVAYCQAAVGWPIKLTNPEVFVISGL